MDKIIVRYSNGRGKAGKLSAFIRPSQSCFNKSRKVSAYSLPELKQSIDKCIIKWFDIVIYYQIDGHTIGSNNEINALKEYYRVCDKKDIQLNFSVTIN